MLQEKANARTVLGALLFMPYAVGVILLSSIGQTGTFTAAVTFFIMGGLAMTFSYIALSMGYTPFKWLTGKFNKQDLKWLGIGYAGLLGSVFIISPFVGGNLGILLALGVGGGVLALILFKSETLMVPWIVHAAYNLTAVVLSTFSIIKLSVSPIIVPIFNFDGVKPSDFFSQAALQFFGVSFSEEMLKISCAIGASMLITKNKYYAMGIAVTLWVVLHSIKAYTIALPFLK